MSGEKISSLCDDRTCEPSDDDDDHIHFIQSMFDMIACQMRRRCDFRTRLEVIDISVRVNEPG